MNRWRRTASGDNGAYAILFAVLLLAVVGAASVVVDLALLREARAQTRSASDSAVVAAAASLNVLDPVASSPRAGCAEAWAYLRQNVRNLPNGAGSCVALPTTGSACTSTSAPLTAVATGGGRTVRVTWPVQNTSPLMTKPDTAPAVLAVGQPYNLTADGADGCARIAVEVVQQNRLGLAGIFGVGEVPTRAASVARSIVDGQTSRSIAALNILEQEECDALATSGQGSIVVDGHLDRPGLIAVETSAKVSCNGPKAGIHPLNNPQNSIRVNGPGGPGTGYLQVFALNPAPSGNPPEAFIYPNRLFPAPTRLTDRYGAKPVTDIFDCPAAPCADGGGPWVTNLKSALGTVGMPAAYEGVPFQELPGPARPSFTCTQATSSPPEILPPGNWWVNCPGGLKVASAVIFSGGVVVTEGQIEVQGGCFAVNVPALLPPPPASPCPGITPETATAPVTTNPAPTRDGILYVRSGRLYKVAQASVYLPQTFTYLGNGFTDLAGGTGSLLWTAPRGVACTPTDLTCQYKDFAKVALWSESTALHTIGGQSNLALRGALYTPRATSVFDGQAGSNQTNAQYWTRTLEVKGQGVLRMVADPDASISRPTSGVALIR